MSLKNFPLTPAALNRGHARDFYKERYYAQIRYLAKFVNELAPNKKYANMTLTKLMTH
jgi:hypothetical protein